MRALCLILKKIWHLSRTLRTQELQKASAAPYSDSARPKGIRRVELSSLIFKIVFEGLAGVTVSWSSPTRGHHPYDRP